MRREIQFNVICDTGKDGPKPVMFENVKAAFLKHIEILDLSNGAVDGEGKIKVDEHTKLEWSEVEG